MKARSILIPLVNLVIFLAAGLLLYKLGNGRSAPTAAVDTDETTGPTNVPVHVAAVSRQTLRRMLTAYGRIEPAPAGKGRTAGVAHVNAPFSGLVAEVDCVEGQRVQAGTPLFAMDGRSAEANLRQAQALLAAGQSALDQSQDAAKQQKVPDWAVWIARWNRDAAQAALDRAIAERNLLAVKAPISGIVQTVSIGPGEMVRAAQPVVDLVDPDRMVLALDVPGFLAGDVKAGQPVLIDVPAAAGAESATRPSSIESQVLFVDPSIDPATGMASVNVALAPGDIVRTGEFLRARIVIEQRADCLAVPAESIVRDSAGNPQIGLVSPDEHQAVLHPVTTGIRQGDLIEVRSDWLEPGAMVVTVGSSALITRTGIQVIGR